MTLRYFPPAYPDESMYSLIVRFRNRFSENSFSTIKELLGKMHLRINPLFVGNLLYLSDQLPPESELSPEYFITNHTALPFFQPFIPTDRYKKVGLELKDGSLNAVHSGLGITAGGILHSKGVRYCPHCVEVEKSAYRTAYLHRTHQLPGVFVCTKHRCLLLETDTGANSRDGLIDVSRGG